VLFRSKQSWHYILSTMLLNLTSPFSLSSTHHPSFHCQLHFHCFHIITAPVSQVNTQGALSLFTDHCSNHSIIIPAAFSSFPATHSSSSSLDLHPSCSIPVVAPIPSHHPSFIFASFPATLSLSLHHHPSCSIHIIAPIPIIPASFLHHFRRLSHYHFTTILPVPFP